MARVILQKGKIESLSVDEVKNYGILTTNEVKVLVSLSSDKPEFLRYKLGTTCGLGVSEIQNLQVKDIVLDYDWLIVKKPDTSRFIPYIDIVRELISKSVNKDSKSRYVIPT